MNTEQIIKLAREAGSPSAEFMPHDFKGLLGVFTRFAALVAQAERDACAKVCDEIAEKTKFESNERDVRICARDIRARSNPAQPKATEPTDWAAS